MRIFTRGFTGEKRPGDQELAVRAEAKVVRAFTRGQLQYEGLVGCEIPDQESFLPATGRELLPVRTQSDSPDLVRGQLERHG